LNLSNDSEDASNTTISSAISAEKPAVAGIFLRAYNNSRLFGTPIFPGKHAVLIATTDTLFRISASLADVSAGYRNCPVHYLTGGERPGKSTVLTNRIDFVR
jgi:hypothetical protein